MMNKNNFSSRILVGITGETDDHWQNKLKEIGKFKIARAALFLERFSKLQRQAIYKALLTSKIREIPLVHARNDMVRREFVFLNKNFGSSYFTIHESSFSHLNKWQGFYKNLFLEMNMDSFIPSSVSMKKIGGFCIDLSHFKADEERWSREFEYIMKRKDVARYFACNHLNGYSYRKNCDLHTIKSLKDFDYLKTLPKFLFGKVIALETENSIAEQLEFKKYLIDFLSR